MKICAIIAEYNPFHNGHKYQIEEAKRITNSDSVVAIMSGNFVQRGEPACFDKFTRAKLAIQNGIDIVFELSTLYATSSSEYFATGAISTLNNLNAISSVSFGVESHDLELLKRISNILIEEPNAYTQKLKAELNKGQAFPVSRSIALKDFLKNQYNPKDIEELLLDPNNILAIEYLKALSQTKSSIEPVPIKRIGTSYNSLEINNNIASSSAIRELFKNKKYDLLKSVVPENVYQSIKQLIDEGYNPMTLDNYEKEILFTLRNMNPYSISQLPDVKEGLENAILRALETSYNIDDLIENIKSKRYTRTRIQRILIHSLLRD